MTDNSPSQQGPRPARPSRPLVFVLAGSLAIAVAARLWAAEMPWVRVADDGRSFLLEPPREKFVPWGFNYDHDEQGRLIEDYWQTEWAKVEEDFAEMKDLRANVVRIHLQLGKFMDSPNEPNEKSLDELDFVAVHLYPEQDKLDEALQTLAGFSLGKPVVIEETFPLKCSPDELETFLDRSRQHAAGWIGFYWGKTPEEYRPPASIGEAITLRWLEFFQKQAKQYVE